MCAAYPEDTAIDYQRGLLPDDAAAAFRHHLPECAACREAVREAESLLEVFGSRAVEPRAAADAKVRREIHRLALQRNVTRPASGNRRRNLAGNWWWAAAAALVLIVAGLSSLRSRTPMVARLTEVTKDVALHRQGTQQPATVGMALYRDDTLVAAGDGSAVVVLEDATRVELGPRTTLALSGNQHDSPGNLRLETGFVSIHAMHRPVDRPLCIGTPGARTEVLGTQFTLAVARQRTNVRVDHGRVRLVRSRDGESVEVPAGHRSSVTDAGRLVSAPTRSGTVLIIVSRQDAGPNWERFNQLMGTRLVSDRLRQLCLAVEVKDHHDVRPEDLEQRPFVIVSHSAVGTGLWKSLRRIRLDESPVPVICLEAIALPVLKMSGPEIGADYRFDEANLPLTLREASHPLAAGLRSASLGEVPCYGWAVPTVGATVITGIARDPQRATAFCYEAGAPMLGLTAPARRVALLLDPDQMTEDRDVAWLLFEAAINWCTDPAAVPRPQRTASFAPSSAGPNARSQAEAGAQTATSENNSRFSRGFVYAPSHLLRRFTRKAREIESWT